MHRSGVQVDNGVERMISAPSRIKYFGDSGGSVVNIGSVVGKLALPGATVAATEARNLS
jgi:hypothetical protein